MGRINYKDIIPLLEACSNKEIAQKILRDVNIGRITRSRGGDTCIDFAYDFGSVPWDLRTTTMEGILKRVDLSPHRLYYTSWHTEGWAEPDIKTSNKAFEIEKELNKKLKESYEFPIVLDVLVKEIAKRRKAILNSYKSSEESSVERKDKYLLYGKVLADNGFKLSKVANFEYNRWEYHITERKIPNKWHKYIEVGNNIKFATIEVLVTKNRVNIGVKLETTGQIGCCISAFKEAAERLEQEYHKIKAIIEAV